MFIDNLEKLISDRGWNRSRLSRESGLPYTTIDGIFKKGTENIKLSTLLRLSAALGVSLDTLVFGDSYSLSAHEKKVIDSYRRNDMKTAVDKLLGIDNDSDERIIAYRAACSDDGHPGEIVTLSDEQMSKLKNAPDTDDGLI